MKEAGWVVVWPEGQESVLGENTDRYQIAYSEEEVKELVQELVNEYADSDGESGAHEANILIFPPNSNIETTKYL